MTPRFLELAEVIEVHRDQIERYGGPPGVRDLRVLLSAVGMPQVGFAETYAHVDIYEMAAAYLFHITRNHPFVDGNKRTGLASALIFLSLNGIELEVRTKSLVEMVESVARGDLSKSGIAEFLRRHEVR
ncbi:MAG: type II toxin-antitoxin system death-on-curing family toxin [Planctomycetota bacterium]